MVVIIDSKDRENKSFLNRETYSNISADSWEMKSDRSYDNGKTWSKGRYAMKTTRAK